MTFNTDAAIHSRIFSLLHKINTQLSLQIPREPSFWSGKAGLALYFAAIAQTPARQFNQHEAHTFSLQLATAALTEIARYAPRDIIQQAWVIWSASAIDELFGESENIAFCHDIEELMLETLLQTKVWQAEFDLIKGLLAVGSHAMARRTSPHSAPLLARVLTLLADMAEQDQQYLRWPSTRQNGLPSRLARFPNGYHDLGLAHGNAGIILFLARLVQQDLHAETAKTMLHKLVPWLLAQRNCGEQLAVFPYLAETPNSESRCGWCYGDVGIAWSLLQAGIALNDSEYLQLAQQLARGAANRPLAAMGFEDHALCHGTLGVSHILRRIAIFFADANLADFSKQLLYQALSALEAQAEMNTAGNPSYLEGWAGIGLALLSANSDIKLNWDYPLLLA